MNSLFPFVLQVALVALHLHGEQSAAPKNCSARDVPGHSKAASIAEVDCITAQEMQQLIERKEAAVQAENYDEAIQLKSEIEALRLLGRRILELETRYDTLQSP